MMTNMIMTKMMMTKMMMTKMTMTSIMIPPLTSKQFSTHLALGISRKLVMFFSSRV